MPGTPGSPKGKRVSSAKKGKGRGKGLDSPHHEDAPVVVVDMSTIKVCPLHTAGPSISRAEPHRSLVRML